jgi:hypothetical protein
MVKRSGRVSLDKVRHCPPLVKRRRAAAYGPVWGMIDQFPSRRSNACYVIGKKPSAGRAATGKTRRFRSFDQRGSDWPSGPKATMRYSIFSR